MPPLMSSNNAAVNSIVLDSSLHEQTLNISAGKCSTFEIVVSSLLLGGDSETTTSEASKSGKEDDENATCSVDVWYDWCCVSKDINFRVELVPIADNATSTLITDMKKVKSGVAVKSNHVLKDVQEGDIVKLIWDNSSSMFTSKQVTFKAGIKKAAS